jgi:hypothetical protein
VNEAFVLHWSPCPPYPPTLPVVLAMRFDRLVRIHISTAQVRMPYCSHNVPLSSEETMFWAIPRLVGAKLSATPQSTEISDFANHDPYLSHSHWPILHINVPLVAFLLSFTSPYVSTSKTVHIFHVLTAMTTRPDTITMQGTKNSCFPASRACKILDKKRRPSKHQMSTPGKGVLHARTTSLYNRGAISPPNTPDLESALRQSCSPWAVCVLRTCITSVQFR